MTDIDEEELDETSGNEEETNDAPVHEEVDSIENIEETPDESAEPEEVVVEAPTYSGSDAFVVFVRHGDKVLLMQRADGVADFPGAWDGVYGIGDPQNVDAVARRIEESTGISVANLTHIRSAKARGLEFGNRLNDVVPILFQSESTL